MLHARGMNARRVHECWAVCDAQGKFRPIHSDDWKETGQENQMSVATSPGPIHRNPLLHLNAHTVRALCAHSTYVKRKHLRHFSNENVCSSNVRFFHARRVTSSRFHRIKFRDECLIRYLQNNFLSQKIVE